MNIKICSIVAIILAAWAVWTKSLYDERAEAIAQNNRLKQELKTSAEQNKIRAEAFAAREQSLINDRKEIENEYRKLLELKKTDEHYSSWSDVCLPDYVSKLMQ